MHSASRLRGQSSPFCDQPKQTCRQLVAACPPLASGRPKRSNCYPVVYGWTANNLLVRLMAMFRWFLAAVTLTLPVSAWACPNSQIADGERMSREGGETFVRVTMDDSEMSTHSKMGSVIRAELEAAVAAEHPDWSLIERLQGQESIWRAELDRIAHKWERKLLRELGRRDRAIYLRDSISAWKPIIISTLALKENRERTEAVRLAILASANCLIPDERKLAKLLAEKLQLELERRKFINAWSDGLYATENQPQRLERLRKVYQKAGPPPIFSVKSSTSTPNDTAKSERPP